MSKRLSALCGVVAVALSLAVAPAIAGKGGKTAGGGSSITLVRLSLSALATSNPRFGEQVTFDVTTNATSQPWVDAKCYQNGKLVYEQWNGFFADYKYGQTYTLGPTNSWPGGAADCTADIVDRDNYQLRVVGSMSFHVDG
jgi:hypothetical protein